MAVGIEIDVSGVSGAIDNLAQIQARVVSWGAVPKVALAIALSVQEDVDERFASSPPVETGGKVFGGVTWERLTEAYLKQRRAMAKRGKGKARDGGQILRDTGKLQQSFQVGNADSILRSTGQSVTVGSDLVYAHYQSETLKRHILVAHPELLQVVANILKRYIETGKA
jgi:hypothetical protein